MKKDKRRRKEERKKKEDDIPFTERIRERQKDEGCFVFCSDGFFFVLICSDDYVIFLCGFMWWFMWDFLLDQDMLNTCLRL
jgi:hypothetical protein